MPVPVKYMDRGWAIKANEYAKKKGWKKTIPVEVLWRLPEDKIIPISFMVPEDNVKLTVTLTINANLKEKTASNHELHIPIQLWNKLPEVMAPDEDPVNEQNNEPGEGMGDGAKKFLGL